ncbi:MAG: NIPSNAP family protein [Pirellula sp.]
MILKFFTVMTVMLLFAGAAFGQSKANGLLYELRSYVSEPGRQSDVLKLIERSGIEYMTKHKIQLVAAWTPEDASDERVFTLVSHKDKASSDAAWSAFQNDAGWKEALQKSMVNGTKPVKSVERIFLTENDYSPTLNVKPVGNRVFELRTYVASEGNLGALNARFRNHTLKLFEKHGMTNIAYYSVLGGEPITCEKLLQAAGPLGSPQGGMEPNTQATGNSLVYFITHASRDAAKQSFDNFRKDPDWQKALKESETAAGKPLTVKDGVKSLFLKPTAFSPLK